MIRYVLGFLFSEDREKVVLIWKNRPAWQAGLFNGVGGKVEEKEGWRAAMAREWREEVEGLMIPGSEWSHVVTILDDQDRYELRVFRAFHHHAAFVRSRTDELVQKTEVVDLPNEDTVPNVQWLVPMCLDECVGIPVTMTNVEGG